MEAYLNKGIKEIINQFPQVENILDEYGIGCAPCTVGTCLLKDIVEIHSLPAEQEQEMMARIAKAIYPDRTIEVSEVKRKSEAKPKKTTYSPPMKKLVDEHVLIKKWVAFIPEVLKDLDVVREQDRRLISEGIEFIRFYADKYHHAKEEEILFKYFDENLDILKVMLEDHKQARSHVQAMIEALDKNDNAAIAEHLTAYGELLSEHIKKEDDILYPWMDKNLTMTQIGRLFSEFDEADKEIGYSPQKYEEFIETLEKK